MNKYAYVILFAVFFTVLSCIDDKKYSEWKNGKLLKYEYFPNGKLKSITSFNNDTTLDGVQSFLHPNGKISNSTSWVNNKKVGEAIEYFDNNKIKTYSFYNLEETVIYTRTYTREGILDKEYGEIFPLSFIDLNKIKNDSFLVADLYILEPPNTDVSLRFYLTGNKDTVVVPYTIIGKKIEIRKKIGGQKFREFAIEAFIRDYDKMKQWEQTNLISIE